MRRILTFPNSASPDVIMRQTFAAIAVAVLVALTPNFSHAQCSGFLGGPSTLCPGQTGTLVFQGSNTSTNYNLYKDGSITGSQFTGNGTTIQWTVGTGSYQVKGVSGTCSTFQSSTVVIGSSSSSFISISTSGSPLICSGDAITLTPAHGSNFSWSGPGVSGGGAVTVSPTSNTTYTLFGNEPVCNQSTSTSITIQVAPKVSQVSTPAGPSSACTGTTISYTASASSNSNGYSWQLLDPTTGNVLNAAGSVTSSGVVTWSSGFAGGSVRIKVTAFSPNGCSSTTSAYTDVTVYATPGAPTVSNVNAAYGSSVTLTASGASGSEGYKWYNASGSVVSNVINTTSLTSVSTTYYAAKYNTGNSSCETPSGQRAAQTVTLYLDPPVTTSTVSVNTCGPKTITIPLPPSGVLYYWEGTDPNLQSTATPLGTSYLIDATGPYYIRAKVNTSNYTLWSPATTIATAATTVNPVDITLTAYDPSNPLVQATHSIRITPPASGSFIVPSGSTFDAKIAITSECNDMVNWTEQVVYDQNATPVGDSRSYFDGVGNSLLSESKDYLSGKVFASQPLYNSYNVAAGSTMSAPILENDFIYKNNFVQNNSGQPYGASDFDLRTTTGAAGEINNPKPLGKQPGTVGWYYSSSNSLEPLTAITDYPYARDFTPEGPDPVVTTSAGVGDQNRMGSTHEVKRERQLSSASDLSHYVSLRSYFPTASTAPVTGYKYITTGPDGKQSVSFVDADGKQLASAAMTDASPNSWVWSYSYYNDLGQLIASIAPNGINPPSTAAPQFITYYKYDHLGRLIETTSPDKGTSRFVYSTNGRIRFSQNQEQASTNRFSYTNYDNLGRLIEAGEYSSAPDLGGTPYNFQALSSTSVPSNSVLDVSITDATGFVYVSHEVPAHAARCTDFLEILYDFAASDCPGGAAAQTNLIGQVSRTSNTNSTTWYSYDEFGQLIKTWQKINAMNNAVKTIDYTYDYFGNVTRVAYQASQSDAFYHHYVYDTDQRLTNVYTSKDGVNKTLHASYFYYLHGPLKRIELGGDKQGIDYVYTVDGALKSINHGDPSKDPGQDGLSGANASRAKDVFGMTMHYNASDYTGAGQSMGSLSLSGSFLDSFNGLPKAITYNSPVDNNQKRIYAYQYDALNQLKDAQWGTVSGSGAYTATLGETYRERIPNGYDNNGNIQSLERKDGGGALRENFSYHYTTGTNKLSSITGGANTISYTYNAIGQLTQQVEGANNIKMSYNAYGLINDVKDASGSSDVLLQTYVYDDRGNLLEKAGYAFEQEKKNTFYVHDAAGNVMAIYDQVIGEDVNPVLIELPLYGAGRIGTYKPGLPAYLYEVNDHLGNVRAVIGVPETIEVTATMEAANQNDEKVRFLRYDNVRKVNSAYFNHTSGAGASISFRLSGVADEKIGLARSLYVSPGDAVDLSVYAKYADPVESNWSTALGSLITNVRAAAGGVVIDGGAYPTNDAYLFPYGGLLSKAPDSGPKAYLNYLFFNSSFVFQPGKSGYVGVTTAAKTTDGTGLHEHLSTHLDITEPGYLYVYLSNENSTPVEVYFDDFDVKHTQSSIVAGADYYPYGLAMEGREIRDEPYRYGYQGQFSEKDLATGKNEFELRMYDPRIGRWLSPDPNGQYASPYVAMGNNPVITIDADGGFDGDPCLCSKVSNGIRMTWDVGLGGWQLLDPIEVTFASQEAARAFGRVFSMGGQEILYSAMKRGSGGLMAEFDLSYGGAQLKGPMPKTPVREHMSMYRPNFWEQIEVSLDGNIPSIIQPEAIAMKMGYSLLDDGWIFVQNFYRGSDSRHLNGSFATPKERQISVLSTASMFAPLGLGSTGRTVAQNFTEQLAMEEIMSNPLKGQIIQGMAPLNDPRWLGWRKMQYIHTSWNEATQTITKHVIHYVGKFDNGVLKAVDDFKFK